MAMSDLDRGWSWVVLATVFLYQTLGIGLAFSAGVYNAILINAFPDFSKVAVSWIGTLPTGCLYAAGPISGVLTNKYGCRFVYMLGGLMTSSGMILSFFCPNLYYLYFTFGILSGFGVGISFIPCMTAINFYFKRYRNLATGIAVSGVSFGSIIFPPLITFLNSQYSWRESMLILGALEMNIIVCGAVVFPHVADYRQQVEDKPRTVDLSPLRKKSFIFLCLNVVFFACGISIVYVHLTAYSESCGISPAKSAMLMSAIGIANLCGRLTLGSTASHPKVKVILFYGICHFLTGITTACFVIPSISYPVLVVLSCLFGLFASSFGGLLPATIIELVGIKRFGSGYGYLMIFMAVGQFAGGPLAGFLFDTTRSYKVSFFVSSGISVVAGLTMKLVLHWKKTPTEQPLDTKVIECQEQKVKLVNEGMNNKTKELMNE